MNIMFTNILYRRTVHSLSEWGFQVPKRHQAPAHIWDLPRWWKSLLWMYKIFDMRTFGLSHQFKGPTTGKVAKTGSNCINCKKANFTVVGPLIWCDNPKVRMSKILYIHNNDFHHLGRSQICAGAWYVFGTWKAHSETLWFVSHSPRNRGIGIAMYLVNWHATVDSAPHYGQILPFRSYHLIYSVDLM